MGRRGPESRWDAEFYSRGFAPAEVTSGYAGSQISRLPRRQPRFVAQDRFQNGLTITRMTIPIISSVGSSLTIRQCRAGFVLRSSPNARTDAEKYP